MAVDRHVGVEDLTVRLSGCRRALASSLEACEHSCVRVTVAARALASQLHVLGTATGARAEVLAQREREAVKLSYLEPHPVLVPRPRRASGWHPVSPIVFPPVRKQELPPSPPTVIDHEMELERRQASMQSCADEVRASVQKLEESVSETKALLTSGQAAASELSSLLQDPALPNGDPTSQSPMDADVVRAASQSAIARSTLLSARLAARIQENGALVAEVDSLVHKSFRTSLAPMERWSRPRTGASPRTIATPRSVLASTGVSLTSTARLSVPPDA